MQEAELLKRKVASAEDLQSIVKTMKVLAAVGIRQFEQAVASLVEYHQSIEYGFQVLLRDSPGLVKRDIPVNGNLGIITFGSGQGLCGRFNDQIMTFTKEKVDVTNHDSKYVMAVGHYITGNLEIIGWKADKTLPVPGSVGGILSVVNELLLEIEAWRSSNAVGTIYLFNNRLVTGTSYEPYFQQLFPLDYHWLETLQKKRWDSRTLPFYSMDWDRLFGSLVQQYIFVSLYRAMAESLAAEHASRLTSMQAAEKKISEHLHSMNVRLRDMRQTIITDEILDIMSGYEVAMTGKW